MKQYEEAKEKFFAEQAQIHVQNKYNWEHDVKETSSYEMDYMSYNYENSEDLQGLSLVALKQEIEDFEDELSEINTGPLLEIELTGDAQGDYDSSMVDRIYLEATYYVPMNAASFSGASKRKFREFISEQLQPEQKGDSFIGFMRTVECKALQMFEEEELTWKGLQKLVYGSCDL